MDRHGPPLKSGTLVRELVADHERTDGRVTDPKRGRVSWYNPSKGYGAITPDDGNDVLVQAPAVIAAGRHTLAAGQVVEYEADEASVVVVNLRVLN
ncbi:cold shock domain-containing protein [Streptomyces sp. PvR034]|uniref:cold-shock protein n=1 Tax=Streptomyces sp. PvR034 TaxID=3156401 RepID=UPI0033968229